MTKVYQITPERLADPIGSDIDVEKMKLGATHYLKQLGFSQRDIGAMIDMKRSNVQKAVERVAERDTPLKRKSAGRPTNLDDHTRRHLERIIKKSPFITRSELAEELRSMNQPCSRLTVQRWLKELDFNKNTRLKKLQVPF
jgi:transposase